MQAAEKRLAPRLAGPLAGVQVVVTRPEDRDGPLTRRLVARGARALHWPAVRFEPPEDPAPLDAALRRLSAYDGIVFTSPRAVDAVCGRVRQPAGRPWVAAVGAATCGAAERAGWRVDLVPSTASSSGLACELAELDCSGSRVLFPASSIARDELPRALRRLGATVDHVTAYRTVPNESLDAGECLAALDGAPVSIVTFASPSAVRGLAACLGGEAFARLLSTCPSVAIGATTAAALAETGVTPAAVAATSTMTGLADAVELAARRGKEA